MKGIKANMPTVLFTNAISYKSIFEM